MAKETLVAVLEKQPFVEEFQHEHIEKLAALAKRVRFDRGQIIFREGDDCSEFYLLVSGRVGLEIVEQGLTMRVQTLSAGDELGWSAILMGRGKYFQARALEDVDALAFEGSEVLAACRADKSLGFALMYRMLGVVSERLQATRLQLHDLYSPMAKRAGN
jgi:CRP-like cAMP-binding protein